MIIVHDMCLNELYIQMYEVSLKYLRRLSSYRADAIL